MQKKKHTPFTFCVKLEQIDKSQLQKKKKNTHIIEEAIPGI